MFDIFFVWEVFGICVVGRCVIWVVGRLEVVNVFLLFGDILVKDEFVIDGKDFEESCLLL